MLRISSTQSGLALPIAILLLFVMTLVGVTALNTAILQEDMTGNTRLRQSAFNAAEMTLRDAENHVAQVLRARRAIFFGDERPSDLVANPGDTCTNGYCVPAQFTSPASTAPNGERWEDPDLDVWETDGRHREYSNFIDANTDLDKQNIFEAPKYISEFLGNVVRKREHYSDLPEYSGQYLSNCTLDSTGSKPEAPNDKWPYCAADPAAFRITVRATAGPPARQAVVMLQSTVITP